MTAILTDWSRRYGFDDLEQLLDPAPPDPEPARPRSVPYIGPERPGDAFNARHTGGEILVRLGFRLVRRDRNGDEHYLRPDKRNGTSATVYADGHTTVWSESCIAMWPALRTRRPFDAFGLYAATSHGGDFAAATSELARQGYGEPRQPDDLSWLEAELPVITASPLLDGPPAQPAAPVEETWPDPEPLSVPLGHGCPFPLDALPAFIADYCVTKAHALQCPVDTLAHAAIGALSIITLDKVRVHVDPDDDWWEDSNLYLVSVLPSGMSKSPAFKAMLNCLRTLQRDLIEEATRRIQEAAIEREIKEKQAKKLTEAASLPEADPNAIRDAVKLRMELEMGGVPLNPRFLGADVTMEKLADLFKLHGGRFALVSTEGGIFKIMAGQYSERGSAMLDVPLQAWSGDSLDQDRFSRDVGLDRVLLSMCLATQPRSIEQIGRNEEMRGSGLTARFMYSVPRTTIGNRDRRPARLRGLDRAQVERLREAYEERIIDAGTCLQHPGVATLRLELSGEAHDLFSEWDQRHENALAAGRDLAHMAEWQMKARASVVRLAGLLHLAEALEDGEASHINRVATQIEVGTMARALAIGDYWVDHARQVHEVWESTSGGMTYAKEIVEWAIGEWGEGGARGAFTVTEAHKECIRLKHRNEKVGAVQAAVELLGELGWVRTPSDFPGRRGAPAPVVTLHPRAAELWKSSETNEKPEEIASETAQESASTSEVVRQMRSEIKDDFLTSSSLRISTESNFDVSPYPFSHAHLSHKLGEPDTGGSSPLTVTESPAAADPPAVAPPEPAEVGETTADPSEPPAGAQRATGESIPAFGDW